eukprot:gene429-624_t
MASENDAGAPPVPPSTLLKYQDPVPVAEAEKTYAAQLEVGRQQREQLRSTPMITNPHDVLHMVLPPRQLGKTWVQMVSEEAPTRAAVRELTTLFEFRLKDSRAKPSGICDVRSIIYGMCFDELIRQITVDCPERGLLLMRIRDELRMTTDAYRTLYEASAGLGRRKAIEAERGKQDMLSHVDSLQTRQSDLQKEVKRLEAKLKAMERCCQEQQQADHKKYAEEIQFLQHTNK